MSEEMRRILEMAASGKITQQDAARLLEALGENEPAPAQPQESQPPQDGTWEAEHQGDEDCQGPTTSGWKSTWRGRAPSPFTRR